MTPKAAGEESRTSAVASQAIEAQPAFGQISHQRGHGDRIGPDSIPNEQNWRRSDHPRKNSGVRAKEKER